MDKLSIFEEFDLDEILRMLLQEMDLEDEKYILLVREEDDEYNSKFAVLEVDVKEEKEEEEKREARKPVEWYVVTLDHNREYERERDEIKNIKYERPVCMGEGRQRHEVYQRIIMKNKGGRKSVYEFIKEELARYGVKVEIIDVEFGGEKVKYIAGVDGWRENFVLEDGKVVYREESKGKSWEVLVDDKFIQKSIDKAEVREGQEVELRLKTGCGGYGEMEERITENSDVFPVYLHKRVRAAARPPLSLYFP